MMHTPKLTTGRTAASGVLILAVVGLTGVGVAKAVAASPPAVFTSATQGLTTAANAVSTPPAPVIISGPANPTASTTSVFAFTDSQAKVTFSCSLDLAAFGTCTSPRTYGGLGNGSHNFRVAAQTAGSTRSGSATYAWTVDTTAPSIAIGFPANGGVYNAAGYTTCSPAGVCGGATDSSGVSSAALSIRQAASARYWNGTGFNSTAELFIPATLGGPGGATTTWRYSLSRPADGSYTVHVRATDNVGNTTSAGGYAASAFAIDTASPPAPTLTGGPMDPPYGTGAAFHNSDGERAVTFRCSLDGGPFVPCDGTPKVVEYGNLAVGDHTFRAEAVDAAGNVSPVTSFNWTIANKNTFPITGSVSVPLFPGGTAPVNLRFGNPNTFALKVVTVTITVQHATTKNGQVNAGCDGPTNMVVVRGFTGPVTITAGTSRSLQELGIPQSQWPQVSMPNLPVNQDACKGTTFTFTYSGTGTK